MFIGSAQSLNRFKGKRYLRSAGEKNDEFSSTPTDTLFTTPVEVLFKTTGDLVKRGSRVRHKARVWYNRICRVLVKVRYDRAPHILWFSS